MEDNKVKLNIMPEPDYKTREAFNSLRTNIKFCGSDIKVIMTTSCVHNEGKTDVTMKLARSFAENGQKIVVIDADLRKSVIVGRYHIESSRTIAGLSHYLSGQAVIEEIIYRTNVENMDLIMTGYITPNPTELLGSREFSRLLDYLRKNYDGVIIDSPPLGSVIDAAVIAPKCDGVILVIENNAISYRFAQDVKKQLEVTGCRILGAVMNKVDLDKNRYYNRYYKKYYGKYYNQEAGKTAKK